MVVRGDSMVGDLLRDSELPLFFRYAVMPVARKVGLPIRVSMPAAFARRRNDAVGVLLEEGIGGKLTGLAAGGAERDSRRRHRRCRRFDIIVQTLIETVMTGNVVLLTAFFV